LSGASFDDARIEVLDVETKQRKTLQHGGSYARYVPTGHIVFVRDGTLYAMGFDADARETTGPPFPILEDVTQNPIHGSAQFDFSANGILVYSTGSSVGRMASLVGADRDGNSSPLSGDVAELYHPRYSPDGRKIALYEGNFDDADVWITDLDRGTRTRLTFSERADWAPLWSPDGQWIAFCSTREGAGNLYRKPADGSREAERLTESENLQVPESWSRDGRFIALSELTGGGGWDIMVLDVESGEVSPFLQSSFQDVAPAFSPDGRWIAYRSNESGRYEVYVRPFPGPGGKWQISTSGGGAPLWSQDGKQIYYATPDDKMVAVPITATESTLTAGNPVELLDTEPYVRAPETRRRGRGSPRPHARQLRPQLVRAAGTNGRRRPLSVIEDPSPSVALAHEIDAELERPAPALLDVVVEVRVVVAGRFDQAIEPEVVHPGRCPGPLGCAGARRLPGTWSPPRLPGSPSPSGTARS
jgi:serine/threonine-protein kinase